MPLDPPAFDVPAPGGGVRSGSAAPGGGVRSGSAAPGGGVRSGSAAPGGGVRPSHRDLSAVGVDPSRTLIAFDFDGTLAPIVDRPADAAAHPDALALLNSLAAAGYRLAIITGRPVDDVLRLGAGFASVPGLAVRGHYGMERWADGTLTTPPQHAGVAPARGALQALAAHEDGVHIEDKGHAVALHTRTARNPADAIRLLTPAAERIAAEFGLEAVPGRFVVELRPPGIDKGAALRELVAESGVTAVVFAGDDLGDLPAVRALRALDVTGYVICSDSPESPEELRREADICVDGPAGVIALLAGLVG